MSWPVPVPVRVRVCERTCHTLLVLVCITFAHTHIHTHTLYTAHTTWSCKGYRKGKAKANFGPTLCPPIIAFLAKYGYLDDLGTWAKQTRYASPARAGYPGYPSLFINMQIASAPRVCALNCASCARRAWISVRKTD